MKNPLVKFLGIALLAAAVIVLGRDAIIQASVGGVCRAATGLNIGIGKFHSSLLSSTIDIGDLKLYNPPGFSEKIMFSIPKVRVGFDLGSVIAGKPRLKEVHLHLGLLEIEKNKQGKLNLDELKPAGGKKENAKPAGKAPQVHIDVLRLQIDKVVYKDFSRPIPYTQEFNLNIDETYRNVEDVRAIAPLIIGSALRNQALGALTNFKVDDLLKNFQASGINVADLGLEKLSALFTSDLGQKAQNALGDVTDQLGSLFGAASKKK